MSTVPYSRKVFSELQCEAGDFDEHYLRAVKGQNIGNGYFHYSHRHRDRFLLIKDGEPLCGAWDDGHDGSSTALADFFEPFLHEAKDLSFYETSAELVAALALSWQRFPDAHSEPGLLDPVAIIATLLGSGNNLVVRLRRGGEYSFALISDGKLAALFSRGAALTGAEAQEHLEGELSVNRRELAIDIYRHAAPARAEDWAKAPLNFQEGMVRYYTSTAPHIIVEFRGKELQRLPLRGGKTTVGRDHTNHIVIDNLSVSRRHAIITFGEGGCVVEDLGSANGTLVNGVKIFGPTTLNDNAEVKLGKHTLRFRERAVIQDSTIGDTGADRTMFMSVPDFGSERSKPQPLLTFGGQSYRIRQTPFSIGSEEECDLVVQGRGVRPQHAVINEDEDGEFWIQHKGGLWSATRVNGKRVKESPLSSGDLIQVGEMMMSFHMRSESIGQ